MDERIREKLRTLYQSGMSLRQISKVTHRSHEWVRTNLGQAVHRKERKNIDRIKLLQLYKKMGSYQKVGTALGVSRAYVYEVVKKYGGQSGRKRQRPS